MARSKSSNAWLRRHVTDPYVRRAQMEGYRARSAYKLEQLAARDKLFRRGMTVVDLGAAPGGWSQVAARAVAPGGTVIALDLLDMPPVPGVAFVHGDIRDEAALCQVEALLAGRAVDLVLSDMAPNMSGIAAVDQARAAELASGALEFAARHLKPHGKLLVKMFYGAAFDGFLREMRTRFREVRVRKPEASRSTSSEVYVLGADVVGAGSVNAALQAKSV